MGKQGIMRVNQSQTISSETITIITLQTDYQLIIKVLISLFWAQTLSRFIGTGFFNLRQRRELAHVSW